MFSNRLFFGAKKMRVRSSFFSKSAIFYVKMGVRSSSLFSNRPFFTQVCDFGVIYCFQIRRFWRKGVISEFISFFQICRFSREEKRFQASRLTFNSAFFFCRRNNKTRNFVFIHDSSVRGAEIRVIECSFSENVCKYNKYTIATCKCSFATSELLAVFSHKLELLPSFVFLSLVQLVKMLVC